jgi:hypothetical protein
VLAIIASAGPRRSEPGVVTQSRGVVDRDGDGRELGGMMTYVGSHRFSRRDKR